MEICIVGGSEEVGKNMTALKIEDDVFIFDLGLHIPGIVELQEEHLAKYAKEKEDGSKGGKIETKYTEEKLRAFGAIPDDKILEKIGWKDKIRAIFIGHAHLDHVGGVPFLIKRYPKIPIFATDFTIKIIQTLLNDEGVKHNNKLIKIKPKSSKTITGKSGTYKIDFIHATHSTIGCVFIAVHTKEGIFFYGLDFKFDNKPTLGSPPDYKSLSELGRKKVKVLILDALYSGTEKKPGSETIAKHLLEEALEKVKYSKKAIFITTFSSHIERLNNIVELGKRTKREIVFMGRGLYKYVTAANDVGKCPFFNKITLLKYNRQVNSFLRKVEKSRDKYIVVCTGHQAEENSTLDKIVRGDTPFSFKEGDNLIFSSSIIPAPVNIAARDKMDGKLKRIGVRIQKDVHVHGHGSREDMRDIIRLLKPEHVIPSHGSIQQEAPFIDLVSELGYRFGETSHLTSNGKVIKI